ncbi:hypothetical protein GCM10027345_10770 [Hymenobacter daeguensis]
MRAALAQSPTIIAAVPAANAVAVPRSAAVQATFSHPLTAASAGALRVFSSQRGGMRTRTRPAAVSGNALSFTPSNYDFRPGEKVTYTISRQAASSGGALVNGRVVQFTTAVSGTGVGSFVAGPTVSMSSIGSVATGDVDGDGDLDLLLVNTTGSAVNRLLNGSDATGSNTGTFGSAQAIAVAGGPMGVALADVDGDGDLDLLTANSNSTSSLSVCLNGGNATGSNTGTFGSPQNIGLGSTPQGLAVGDVDGDGDQDVVTVSQYGNAVSVRLNGGDATGSNTGTFSNGSNLTVGNNPSRVALGDVDNDGDLDLLVANYGNSPIAILLNGGDATGSNTGTFSNGGGVVGSSYCYGLALGDIDGDGDLDIIVGGGGNNIIIFRNGGDATGSATGIFSNTQAVTTASATGTLTMGDVDADGDLDVVITSTNRTYLTVALNGSDASGSNTGVFGGLQFCTVAGVPSDVVLGDLDGDGDLDALSAQYNNSAASVSLNGGSGPLATASAATAGTVLQAYPNPARSAVAVAGAEPGVQIVVLDALSRPVLATRADAAGAAALVLPAGLRPGLYLVRAGAQVQRLVVE